MRKCNFTLFHSDLFFYLIQSYRKYQTFIYRKRRSIDFPTPTAKMVVVPLPVASIGNLETSAEVVTKSDENLVRRKRRCRGYPSNCGIKDKPLDLRTPATPLRKCK